MHTRIVITGVGVVASNGVGKDAFWRALRDGVTGEKPVSLFDVSTLRTRLAGEIGGFRPEAILGAKGLRTLDRTTRAALVAAQLALDDAGIPHPLPEEMTDGFGVALGSTMGSVWSISEFDKEALREGPRSVNPALFPNTVINSPASHISIRFNIQGFNATISSGFCSGIDAMYYAMNMIRLHDYRVVLAGGVEELCEQTYKGFYKLGYLAGSREGTEEVNCPFDRRRNGALLGEGAAIMVLEELGHAKARGAPILAEVLGYGASFDPASRGVCNPRAQGAAEAICSCLDNARIAPDDIDYIAASANSTLDCDAMETKAIKAAFGPRAARVPVSAVKSMTGECFSASGALAVAAAVGSIAKGFVPPTVNYARPERRCDLDYVGGGSRGMDVGAVLVNAFSPTGPNASLAVGAYG